jgi:hypothetical protein
MFIFNPLESIAQTGQVSGKLIDSKTQQPVSFVQVALFGNSDSTSPEAYSDTNEDGVFNLIVPQGKYIFKAFVIGYQDLVVSNLQVDGSTNLGELIFISEGQNLDEVVVTTSKLPVRTTL